MVAAQTDVGHSQRATAAQAHAARHHERRVGRQRAKRGRGRAVAAGRHGIRHAQVRIAAAAAVRVSLWTDLLLFAPFRTSVLEPYLQRNVENIF